ncbi:CGNR zinc finger domain-containing protein [Kribbella sp. NPDC051586]|uniref:CGNR zinc finger domain-containing protein n=1 Tax=Kribbella sp. NPDC051586 TaxID=3364118 RepID=UPI0037A45D36
MTTLAFALAATIKHDGRGGVADLLATPAEAAAWLADHQDEVTEVLGRPLAVGGEVREELVQVRRAVRALFARTVAPEPPSKADAHRLMDVDAALRMINRAAGRLGTQKLVWQEGGEPVVEWSGGAAEPVAVLVGAVGRSTIEFLTGPDRARLRACPAARCVKYFLQDDPRQTWCSASCGNRERVNRHYRKRHAG